MYTRSHSEDIRKNYGSFKALTSPSSVQRSSRRLVKHLYKMIQMIESKIQTDEKVSMNQIRDLSNCTRQVQMVDGHTRDTFTIHKTERTSFCTSTPNKIRHICYGCKKYLFEAFIEDGTWSGQDTTFSTQDRVQQVAM